MMKPYPSYKDSGVEWIGKIPSLWGVTKLKYRAARQVQYGLNIESSKYVDEGIRFLRITDINEDGSLSSTGVYLKDEDLSNDYILEPYDLLFSRSGATVGKSCLYSGSEKSAFAGYLVRFSFGSGIESKFIKYFSESNVFWNWITLQCSQSTIENVSGKKYSNLPILKVSEAEMANIVKYLDKQTQQIDDLIENTEKRIELLKEKRTALINHCVTKGLNPDVEMKDSGDEWIGEIPKHWETIALKYISRGNVDALGNDTSPDYELDYIEINDVSSTGIISEPTHYEFSKSPSRCRRIVRKNDTIVSTVRTYLKAIGFIEEDASDLICSTGFCVITPTETVVPRYLFHLVRTEWFVSNVISNSEGVSYPAIQADKLMNIKVILPLKSEQFHIVSYLDNQTQKIDSTIEIETKRIELLKEYRQSLISNVVTGKIDVRDEVAI